MMLSSIDIYRLVVLVYQLTTVGKWGGFFDYYSLVRVDFITIPGANFQQDDFESTFYALKGP